MKRSSTSTVLGRVRRFTIVVPVLLVVFSCARNPQVPQSPTQPPEAAASDDTEAAKFCDNPPWTRADLVEIERQLEQVKPEEILPVPNKVDELRSSFERHGCASRPSAAAWEWGMFDSIWQRIMEKAAEAERLTTRASLEKEERALLASFDQNFAQAKEAARSEAARKKGFVEVRSGLSRFLEDVRDAGMPLSDVRKRLVLLLARDDDFKVLQVLGSTGLFINDELRVFVDAGADGLYEGTPLSAVGTQFQVAGTRSYTALVGVRQAFVLKPVAELDLGRAPLLSLLPSYEQDGFVTMGEYLDGALVECADLPSPVFQRLIQALSDLQSFDNDLRCRRATLLLKDRCEVGFSREPAATCTTPNGSHPRTYPRPPDFDGFDEASCLKSTGKWAVSDLPKE